MKLIEVKVIFEADSIKIAQKEISDLLYEFGIQGLKIEEPMKRNALDFYKDEKFFLAQDYAISAYFPNNFYAERKKNMFIEQFEEKFGEREDLIYTIDFYELDDEDYQNAWKKYLFPEKVSEKFVVKPTWREYEADEDEMIIELDPGRAFGTGSHPTTSLAMRLLEKNLTEEKTVIDVGTGSGILMIAAEKLGASEIWGVDIDEMAVEVTHENLELNSVDSNKTKVFKGNLLDVVTDKKFDVVVANILADVILLLLDDMKKVLADDGIMVLSGIIEDKQDDVVNKLTELGYKVVEILQDKEWVGITASK